MKDAIKRSIKWNDWVIIHCVLCLILEIICLACGNYLYVENRELSFAIWFVFFGVLGYGAYTTYRDYNRRDDWCMRDYYECIRENRERYGF